MSGLFNLSCFDSVALEQASVGGEGGGGVEKERLKVKNGLSWLLVTRVNDDVAVLETKPEFVDGTHRV